MRRREGERETEGERDRRERGRRERGRAVKPQCTWSMEQKMWASSCWKRRTRVRPVSAPDSSLRCSTPKSAIRRGSSRHDRGRWSNIKLRSGETRGAFKAKQAKCVYSKPSLLNGFQFTFNLVRHQRLFNTNGRDFGLTMLASCCLPAIYFKVKN